MAAIGLFSSAKRTINFRKSSHSPKVVTFTNASPLPAGVSAATAVVTHSTTEKANVVTITLNRALVDGDKVGITTGVLNAGNTTDTAAAATFTYNATTGLFTTP